MTTTSQFTCDHFYISFFKYHILESHLQYIFKYLKVNFLKAIFFHLVLYWLRNCIAINRLMQHSLFNTKFFQYSFHYI